MIFYVIYPLACLVGWLPRWAQLGLSNSVRWFLYDIFKYRLKVVRENLLNSFPDYTDQQRLEIEKRFYAHLADVFVESMVLASISKKKILKRMTFSNSESFEQQTKGRSIIAMAAHYGTWEYTSNYALHTHHEALFGVYRPLASKSFDRYFLKCRSRFGSVPVAMNNIAKEVLIKRHSKQGVIVALIADQAPPRYDDVDWMTFLNQPTQFFMGAERLARRMNMPVYFTYVEQSKRGYYNAIFEMIYDGKEQVEELEITRRYAEKLEAMIVARPELWMWSHRRWKRKPLDNDQQ